MKQSRVSTKLLSGKMWPCRLHGELAANVVRDSASAVQKEMLEAYALIERLGRGVVYYGSARLKSTSVHWDRARTLGRDVAKLLGCTTWSGGGPGMMEAATLGKASGCLPPNAFRLGQEHPWCQLSWPHELKPFPAQMSNPGVASPSAYSCRCRGRALCMLPHVQASASRRAGHAVRLHECSARMCLQVPWMLGCPWAASASAEKPAPPCARPPTCPQTAQCSADSCPRGRRAPPSKCPPEHPSLVVSRNAKALVPRWPFEPSHVSFAPVHDHT